MTTIKVLSLVIVGLLSGCAGEPVLDVAPLETTAPEVHEPAKELSKTPASATKPAKEKKAQANATSIDPQVMYLLLTAELAGQRNQYGIALEGYMQAAARVKDPRITERAAKIATFLQDSKKADKAVNLWLQQDVNNADAHMLAALSALRMSQKAAALEHLEALLRLDPAGFDGTLLELLKSLGPSANVAFVNGVLDELAIKHPQQAVIYFVQALFAMQTKNNVLAADKLQHALSLQPSWDKALIAEAQLALLNNDLEKAEALSRSSLQKYPEDSRFRRLLAQVLIKANKFEIAVVEYHAILKAHPNDGDAMFSLALLHLQLQQDSDAKVYLEKLATNHEWAGSAGYYLGKLAMKENQLGKALVWYDSVSNGPFVFDSALSAVSILLEQHRYQDAHNRLDKMQQQFPEQAARLLGVRAEVYNDQKEYKKAYKLLSDALQKNPGQKELLYARSLVAERMGNLVDMEADLLAILRQHPDDVATLNALGYTLANKTTRLQEAERYLTKALRLQPDMAVIVDSYGWLLFKKGQPEQAKAYLQRAYDKQPQAEIAGHLIEVLMKLGLKSEARVVWDKAIMEDAEDVYLLELKRRFFAN